MICNNNYLADMLRVCEIKYLIQVMRFQSPEVYIVIVLIDTGGKFNNASALGRSLYWCQALHIINKDMYQSTSARRALALLNSPLAQGSNLHR